MGHSLPDFGYLSGCTSLLCSQHLHISENSILLSSESRCPNGNQPGAAAYPGRGIHHTDPPDIFRHYGHLTEHDHLLAADAYICCDLGRACRSDSALATTQDSGRRCAFRI